MPYPKVLFTTNFNGKLFSDTFSTVRDYDPEKFSLHAIHEIDYKNKQMGIAEIVAVREFKYKEIRDVLSFIECGRPPHYLASILHRYYAPHNQRMMPDKSLLHVVYQYRQRNLEMQSALIREWWNEKLNVVSA